ncbi:uncharacterized protein EI90DRAFT_3070800, partial [Cantharellus anzutake]|uniref:uncharacterized protein n=1 Tax=Cantharellus anzutake TaxID=1750568 RepID=UPI001906C155
MSTVLTSTHFNPVRSRRLIGSECFNTTINSISHLSARNTINALNVGTQGPLG